MVLKALVKGEIIDIPIKQGFACSFSFFLSHTHTPLAGEMFMLPSNIPHSPQRFENTMGLVVERERLPSEHDGLLWFVPGQTEILYDEYFHCQDLGTELVPAMERFWQSEEYKTKQPRPRGEDNPVLTVPDPEAEPNRPFDWSKFLQFKHEERSSKKHKTAGAVCNVFNGEFVTSVCMGEGSFTVPPDTELWAWQQGEGSRSRLKVEGAADSEEGVAGGEGKEGAEADLQGSAESEAEGGEGEVASASEAKTLTAKLGEDECVIIPKDQRQERTFSYKVKGDGSLFVIYSRAFSQ